MIRNIVLLFCIVSMYQSAGQCLTDFSKLIPDRRPTYSEAYGRSVSVYDDILAVGAPSSDTLGPPGSGIIYLYQKAGLHWTWIGVLMPSSPIANAAFGRELVVSENYILASGNGALYVYRKPVGGWQTTTETTILKPVSATTGFGSYFDLSEDEQTLAITDTGHDLATGAFYVYHKQPHEEWSTTIVPYLVANPDKDNNIMFFGIGGVQIVGNKIACATVTGFSGGYGTIYVFNDDSGNFANLQLEARLTETVGTTGSYGPAFIFTNAGIFKYLAGNIVYYPAPLSGTWSDSEPTCAYSFGLIDTIELDNFFVNYTASEDALYVSAKLKDESGRLIRLTKQGADWCGPLTREIIYEEPPPAEGGSTLFVRSLSCYNDSEIALSWTSSSASRTAVAVGTFSRQPDDSWVKQTLFKSISNANDFQLGRSLKLNDTFMFSGARQERTLDRDPRGAVYIYQKQGTDWVNVNKLSEPPVNASDQRYGSSLASHGNYLAVAAFGYGPGKLFMYEGSGGNFTNPQLIQTLTIPPNKFVDSYGNIVMNNGFLVVPAATNPPSGGATNLLMFFKKDSGNQWHYVYDLVLGPVNVILKRPPSIDIENDILVASDGYRKVFIIEYQSATDQWQINHTLTASDPDNDPFIGSATVDGSYFGNAVKLSNDKIFVGVPGKNFEGINDVGAIYIYTKQNGSWQSGTESTKLLPVVKSADLYFGFSIDVLENTLITGGPSLTQAGKVYVIQSKDYFWTETIQLLYLEGDTFTLDYYGYEVALNQDDFFITAPLENNAAGLSAGTIYVTLPPPIVKLMPPTCFTQPAFTLFGYPFDGLWSGAGILDASTGLFDPATAGIGTHELMYETPNCFYTGKLLIDIQSQPNAVPVSAVNNVLCEAGKTSVMLAVQEEPGATYAWYYAEAEDDLFSPLQLTTRSITVENANPGRYQVIVNNSYCEKDQMFTVTVEALEILIDVIDEVCEADKQEVTLNATVPGGQWQLNGLPSVLIDQTNQILAISTLANGNYVIGYDYTSSEQCRYRAERILTIDKVTAPTLLIIDNQCADGYQQLQATFNQPGNQPFVWYYVSSSNADTVLLSEIGLVLNISQSGYYGMITTRRTCRLVSPSLFMEYIPLDEIFIPNVFTPGNGDEINDRFKTVSTYASVTLQVYNRYGKLVFNGDGITGWDGRDASSGVYYWMATAIDCSKQAKTFKGWVQLIRQD